MVLIACKVTLCLYRRSRQYCTAYWVTATLQPTWILSLHASDVQVLHDLLLKHAVLRPLVPQGPLVLKQLTGGKIVRHLVAGHRPSLVRLRFNTVTLDTHRARALTRALKDSVIV